MQRRPADAQIGGCAIDQARRGYFRDALAGGQVHLHRVEAKARRHIVIEDAQLLRGAHHVGLLDDADAIDRPGRILFNDRDPMAVAAQRDGCRQSADATPDHEHVKFLQDFPHPIALVPPFHQAGWQGYHTHPCPVQVENPIGNDSPDRSVLCGLPQARDQPTQAGVGDPAAVELDHLAHDREFEG
jgi:hypothetical protein